MHPSNATEQSASRVSTLELFFDLVFVFTITQVSDLVLHAHDIAEVGRALLVLAVIWWMYGGYAWLTNNVGTAQPLNRMLVLIAMAGFLIMALSVPHAFAGDGLAFGLAYLLVNCIHAVLFARSPNTSSAQAIRRLAPFNIGMALLIVVAGLLAPDWRLLLWIVAALMLVVTPLFGNVQNFAIQPAHFVERHGLVLIVAFGESVISIGLGAAGEAVTPPLVAAAVLALALTAALWWSYFSQDEQRAEQALESVSGGDRARMALHAFGYAHLIMISGIVLAAAGVKELVAHLYEPATLNTSALLGVGIALFLLGDVIFRRSTRQSWSSMRFVAAWVCLLSVPLGSWLGGLAQITALLAILCGMLALEHSAAHSIVTVRE